ncbi:hypothetical protein A3L09_00040 [Thermococcus profundus]|uniref:Uncharacterized protein n=1 Tax=Thermococcus profundus TaxID=49899 RepID=A0A2Z2MAZ8_THEPR|nr:DUF257 family protein [Thermococcus profundus]ASJ01762.1 hypothetical protein A3L09_00040 [Thermococcus profundus]
MVDPIDVLIEKETAIALLEYGPTDHPERVFARIVEGWKKRGINPFIVDIFDTLHLFVQNLKFAGVSLDVSSAPVVKVKGSASVGNVLGTIDVVDDFEYHIAVYSRLVRNVPDESRNHAIVLGLEKFVFPFLDDRSKLESYFEAITRKYLPLFDKVSILFLNVGVASEYLIKGLEQDSDYVLRVRRGEVEPVKLWGGEV